MLNKFSVKYHVYYEDTDSGGVVYYANYLKFFERARTDFLRSLGILQSQLSKQENLVFVVRRCEIEYLAAAKLDDVLEVSVIIKKISAASILIKQEIKKSDVVSSLLNIEIVCVNSISFKPKKIPENIRSLILK
jgi:acyl-CoA thioester hydrolase